jgi:hypothetical protein
MEKRGKSKIKYSKNFQNGGYLSKTSLEYVPLWSSVKLWCFKKE